MSFSCTFASHDVAQLVGAHVGRAVKVSLSPGDGGTTITIPWVAELPGGERLDGRLLLMTAFDPHAIRVEAVVSLSTPSVGGAIVLPDAGGEVPGRR